MIKNINDLEKILNKYLIKALELTRDEIFEIVAEKVSEYYGEEVFSEPPIDIPDYYVRTGRLMEELTASNITKSGNMYSFTVGWPDSYLTFRYPGGFQRKSASSKFNGITGLQVLEAFDSGTHGYTVYGSHNYWQEALEEINARYGGVMELFQKNCIKVGIPIMG